MTSQQMWMFLTKTPKIEASPWFEPYDDELGSHYSYDERVPNSRQVKVGDLVVVRQDNFAAGWGIIQNIEVVQEPKATRRCPSCKRATVSPPRTTKTPAVKCSNCGAECEESEVVVTLDMVTKMRAVYRDTWHEAQALVEYQRISEFQKGPKDQNSIRELHPENIQLLLNEMSGPKFKLEVLYTPQDLELLTGGHQEVIMRRRRGQRQFRFEMMRRYGEVCAVSGEQPPQVLEAAHLYSYAAHGIHRSDGGLLMRRDFHSLFDSNFITIDPNSWRIVADPYLNSFNSYSNLDGRELVVPTEVRPNSQLITEHFERTLKAIKSRETN